MAGGVFGMFLMGPKTQPMTPRMLRGLDINAKSPGGNTMTIKNIYKSEILHVQLPECKKN